MVTQRSIFLTTRQNNWNEKYPTPQGRSRPTVGLLPVCAWGVGIFAEEFQSIVQKWPGRKPRCDIGGYSALVGTGKRSAWWVLRESQHPKARESLLFSPKVRKTGRETDRGGALCATSIRIGACCFDGWVTHCASSWELRW